MPSIVQLSRRRFVTAGASVAASTVVVAAGHASSAPGTSMSPAEKLELYVRLRASTDGRPMFGWLDAVRSTVVEGEITPFCRMLACFVKSARPISAELCEFKTLEICFYLDSDTGALLRRFTMPGRTEPIDVPIYKAGPTAARFAPVLDEWKDVMPGAEGGASAAIAPKGRFHRKRSIGELRQVGDHGFLRADEHGRVYPEPDRPPSIFFREWLTFRAPMAEIRGTSPSITAVETSYAALSSWPPWMKMGAIKGHTADNGQGFKTDSSAAFPDQLRGLLREHHPDMLDRPEALVRW